MGRTGDLFRRGKWNQTGRREGGNIKQGSKRKRHQREIFDSQAYHVQMMVEKKAPDSPSPTKRANRTNAPTSSTEDSDGFDEQLEASRAQYLLGIPGFPKWALPQTDVNIEPRYVNKNQYKQILKRRIWREENARDLIRASKERERVERQGYKYKSRHLHAKRRKRGPNGKFLTKSELAALEAQSKQEASNSTTQPTSGGSGGQPGLTTSEIKTLQVSHSSKKRHETANTPLSNPPASQVKLHAYI
ncbi:hypothetical protein AAMO2058_000505700 [Amorphochlora amoebiformis]